MSDDKKKAVPDAPVIPPAPPEKEAGGYTLKHPLNLGDKKIEKVILRRLTGKDMLAVEHEVRATDPTKDYASIGQGERMMRLLARSVGLLFDDVQQMSASDLNVLSGLVSDFL
ncbi:MAG: phage tail assembly protein [Desulfobulbaceae bacterium]|nr:phage tail assembly protein [Desulfobulbaceae bacterium]